eukprot:10057020-Alexandrium_andersonii.AAC.1
MGERAVRALGRPDALLGLKPGAPETDGWLRTIRPNDPTQLSSMGSPAMPELGDPGLPPAASRA